MPAHFGRRSSDRRRHLARFEREPEERIGTESKRIIAFTYRRKISPAKQFNRRIAREFVKIQVNSLREAREIRDDQNDFIFISPEISKHALVGRQKEFERAAAESPELLAQRNQALGPAQQRIRILCCDSTLTAS